ncbi:MAG: adenosine-specific kinase [Candidatus Omnitrophota bacterium]
MLEFKAIPINKPDDVNIIIGQAHFIKSVEDIYEAIVQTGPQIKFGLAFSESSGACLVRIEGNDTELKEIAKNACLDIASGHCFILALRQGYPINILNALKMISEVCAIYCATANPLEVVVAQTPSGRGIMGVIDGSSPKGVEKEADVRWRKDLLRKIGYKL